MKNNSLLLFQKIIKKTTNKQITPECIENLKEQLLKLCGWNLFFLFNI